MSRHPLLSALFAGLLLVGAACSDDGDGDENGSAAASSESTTTATDADDAPGDATTTTAGEPGPTIPPPPPGECADAPASVVQAVAEGLTVPDGSLRFAKITTFEFPVDDFKYAFAADIQGGLLTSPDEIGLWVLTSLDGGGEIWAGNDLAKADSNWGPEEDGSRDDRQRDKAAGRAESAAAVGCSEAAG